MSFRPMIGISAATVAGMGGIAAFALSRAPAGLRLPVHWNAAGVADHFAAAPRALFLPVLICALLSFLMAVIPLIEPMQNRLDRSAPLYRTAWLGLLGMMVLVELHIAAPVFGIMLPGTLPLAGAGLLLVLIGNALPKSRPGFFVGIRTPWTLTDPDNWVATHRVGSRTMMAGGAIMAAAAILPVAAATRMAIVTAALLIALVPPVLYSFLYWRRAR